MSDSDWEEVDPDEWEDITPVAQTKKQPRQRGLFEKVYDASGSALQGATMGYGDELTAAIGSLFGMGYDDTLKKDRAAQKRYESENPLESALFEIGGGLPTAFALPGGQAKTLGGMMKAGAAYGGLTGFGKGEGDGGNRLASALVGGTVGGAVPIGIKGLSAVGKPIAQGLARSPVAQTLGNEAGAILPQTAAPLSKAEAALLRRFKDVPTDKINAMNEEMAQALVEGTPLFLQESGGKLGSPNLIQYARSIANKPASMDMAQEAIMSRAEGAGGRITSILDELSPERDPYRGGQSLIKAVEDKVSALKGKRDMVSSPLYEDAYNFTPEVPKADLARLVQYNKPLRTALERARSMGEAAYLPENSTLAVHEAKMAIDDMIASATAQGNNYEARKLLELKGEVLGLLDKNTLGRYADARKTYEFYSNPINEITDGPFGGLLQGNAKPDNVGGAVLQMSPTAIREAASGLGEMQPIRDAARAGMQRRISNMGDTTNMAKALVGADMPRERLAALMGEDGADNLLRRLSLEDRIASSKNLYNKGSTTASNLAEEADFNRAAGMLDKIMDATKRPLETAANLVKTGLLGPDEELARALAGILFDSQSGATALQKITPYAVQRNRIASNVDDVAAALAGITRPGLASLLPTPQD